MKVALAQLTPTPDPLAACERICGVIEEHPDADLILFPELFIGGYASDGLESRSVTADGPELAGIAASCRRQGTATVVGFVEQLSGPGRFANSAACFDIDGSAAGTYRKTHLFGPAEQAGYIRGDSMLLTRLAGRETGPQICFDIEFPEPSRKLALAGADLLISIAANMEPYAADHRLAARARALENRLPHLYVNRTGSEAGFNFVGESCVVSADGKVIAETGGGEDVLEAEIPAPVTHGDSQTEYLGQIRSDLDLIKHDRTNGEES